MPKPRKRLRAHSKFGNQTFYSLAYYFCAGVPLKDAASATGLTPKTVRAVFLDFRKKLLRPEFRRWHYTASLQKPSSGDPAGELGPKIGYYDFLAQCAFNETCIRNYRLGNRKSRECRSCPLRPYATDEQLAYQFNMFEAIRMFYEQVGIRGEKEKLLGLLLKERMIHTFVVNVSIANSKKLPNGLCAPLDKGFRSCGTLVSLLMSTYFDR